ncbi:MAG: DUF6526 family protein [Chitinophagaceae bacterium]
MTDQNFKNHGRFIILWHLITSILMLAVFVGSIINLINSAPENRYSASLIVAISLILFVLWSYARIFALRAQDRAIRAEESFRHFILTGKPHDSRLHLRQIIALRFASDAEMPTLAKRTVEENLTQKEIKQLIQRWRADHHRV